MSHREVLIKTTGSRPSPLPLSLRGRGVRDARRAFFSAALALLAGCTTVPVTSKRAPIAGQGEGVVREGILAPADPVTAKKDEAQQTTLAAVEEFLSRTQQYQTPGAREGTLAPGGDALPAAGDHPQAPPYKGGGLADQAFANTQVTLADSEPAKPNLAIPAVQAVTVRVPESKKSPAGEPVKSNVANAPLDTRAEDGVALSDKLIAQLRSEAQGGKSWQAEWRLRLTQLAFEQDADAGRVSSELSEPMRSILAALIGAGIAVRNSGADPIAPADEALERVEQLLLAVRERADPKVSAVALCRKVATFGVYEEMSTEEFVSGRSIQTIVYSEIANLRATQGEDGFFETRLGTRLEVLSADGLSYFQREEPEIVDRCRTRRTDFFLAQRITLPPTLPAGDYVLKVMVEDKLANRADEASTMFTIVSPVSVARGKP